MERVKKHAFAPGTLSVELSWMGMRRGLRGFQRERELQMKRSIHSTLPRALDLSSPSFAQHLYDRAPLVRVCDEMREGFMQHDGKYKLGL